MGHAVLLSLQMLSSLFTDALFSGTYLPSQNQMDLLFSLK